MACHRRISRTIHDHLIVKVSKEMSSIDGRVTLRFEFAYLYDRSKHFDSRNQYEFVAFHWYLVHWSMNPAVLDEGGQWLVEEHPRSLEVRGCPWSSERGVASIEIEETSRMDGRKETLGSSCVRTCIRPA